MLLDAGFNLTLRPMKYPEFYEMYKTAIKNTWTVEEVDFSTDLRDLSSKLTLPEKHLINRLVAFFATGDSIVANNLVLNLYKHINSPEARMYLSRQLFEEAVHVEFYLTLLDTYIPDLEQRFEAFDAIKNIPSIEKKAKFCFKWIDALYNMNCIMNKDDEQTFLLNLICFAACIEGLFFFSAFAYVYYFRSRGLLQGLATGTAWVFADESNHMRFAFAIVDKIREQKPDLFNDQLKVDITEMIMEAVECEAQFAEDLLSQGVIGLSLKDMREYIQYTADQRLIRLGLDKQYNSKNPFPFMDLQDVQELANFFERRVTAYQTVIEGSVNFEESF